MESQSASPFFSVIIPTYNREKPLLEAVESVQSQSFKDFELIVIDDGSTDNTGDFMRSVANQDSRVRYIYQDNAERSAARNYGIELSKGKYICFLDSDDIYLDDHLAKFHQTIEGNNLPVAMLLGNSMSEFNGERRKDPAYVTQTDEPIELVLKISICSQRVCLHNSILKEFKYDVTLRVGEDQELWSRIVRKYPIVHSNQFTVVIRDFGDRTIGYMNTDTFLANLQIRKRIIAQDKDRLIRPEWRKFALSAAYYKLAVCYLKQHRYWPFYVNMLKSMWVDSSHFFKDKVLVIGSTIPLLKRFTQGRLPNFVAQ
jgi:glycosyltransferase involved in cell wall biosynthesis